MTTRCHIYGYMGRLVIFPMSGDNTFETSNFADRRISFRNRDGGPFSPTMFLWKKILRNMKQMIIHCFFKKSFSLPELADKRHLLPRRLS